MENIQAKYANLFNHSCYCFCLCYMFSSTKDEWKWLQYIAESVQLGYIDTGCFVSKPLQFIELISGKKFRDVQKPTLKDWANLPNGLQIVELQQPNGVDSHFVVCHMDKTGKILLDFDPSFPSKSWELGKTISYRKFI